MSGPLPGRLALALSGLALASDSVARAAPGDPPAEAIDAVFARHAGAGVPGCALGVFRDGAILYERGYGLADLEQNAPITPDTVFYIASTSKQFTAFAAALLIERGALSPDDPIRRHLPELPAWADGITVDQLIHHTSGISDYLSLWDASGRSYADEIPLSQAIDLIARQRSRSFAPGSAWAYSNSNYVLLAEIVARVSGKGSLRAFADEAMFAPLGMTATEFRDDAAHVVPRRAEGYAPDGRGGFTVARSSFALVGDGGLLTTVRDLLKWDENFYANRLAGGQALIDRVTAPGALADGTPLTQPPYAFGLQTGSHRDLPTVEHAGGFIGFSAQLVRFPTRHLSVAVLCNDAAAPAGALALGVADLYLGAAPAAAADAAAPPPVPAPATVAQDVLARWTGRYFITPPGIVVTIAAAGDGLGLRTYGGSSPLTTVSGETFAMPEVPGLLRFSAGLDGRPSLLIEGIGQAAPAPRLPDPPGEDALRGFAGRYASDELDTWFAIRAAEGGLELKRRYRAAWEKLEAIDQDRFALAGGTLRFSRDAQGRVSGFAISGGRIADVSFEKTE
ncbi:MAG TPA: serine hydrolase domain-containing protein [Croceibacterium sp.]